MGNTKTQEKSGLGLKTWLVIWVAGMAGQLAWNIENQWFNTFVYAKIAPDPGIITWMVALSAIVSTLATFFGGTLSDRVGKRKIFILIGYVMWGVSTIIFGCTQFFPGVVMEAVMVVVFDCVMSMFGSLGNDCGFNTWTTDISTPKNRGSLGTAIAIQPVVATIVGSIGFGAIIDAFKDFKVNGQQLDYFMMFLIVGVFIALVGVSTYFLIQDSPSLKPHKDGTYLEAMKKPFNFKLLKENKLLIYVLCVFMAFFISFNVYFPHILNYFIYSCSSVTWLNDKLQMNSINTIAGAIMAVGLLLGVPLVIVSGKALNKQKFIPVLILSVASNLIGLVILFLGGIFGAIEGGQLAILFIGTFFMGAGYMGLYQALMVWVKDLYPEDMRSQFEGVRMIFYICIPMFLGTLVGDVIVKNLGTPISLTYTTGTVSGFAPNHWLFLVAIGLGLLTFIPIYLCDKEAKEHPPVYQGLDEDMKKNEVDQAPKA
ncbi:MAG: MFS transporter [Bacilli bacterium]|jgi:MFS family permease|nr:MFS transporter [Bacilli bacterium]